MNNRVKSMFGRQDGPEKGTIIRGEVPDGSDPATSVEIILRARLPGQDKFMEKSYVCKAAFIVMARPIQDGEEGGVATLAAGAFNKQLMGEMMLRAEQLFDTTIDEMNK